MITPKLMLRFTFIPISVPNFSQIGIHICELWQFLLSVRMKKMKTNEDFFQKFCLLASWERLKVFSSNLECGLPCMESSSTL